MTPTDLARNLAAGETERDRALGVAIITRGLTDDSAAVQAGTRGESQGAPDHGRMGGLMSGQCKAYFRGRGILRFSGRRCWHTAGHAGQHETHRDGLGAPFVWRWGR